MHVDTLSNPIFSDDDIFDIIYSDKLEILPHLTVTESKEINFLEDFGNFKFNRFNLLNISQPEYDQLNQDYWFIPKEYENINIENWLYNQCTCDAEINRVKEEFNEFKNRDMIKLLLWLKYFVDVCRKNNVVWGVGRGSSVSSYILYLIGVHRINSLQYNLDWKEFLR